MPGPGQNPADRDASVVACFRHGCSSPYHQAPVGQRVWGVHRNAIATVPREPYGGQNDKMPSGTQTETSLKSQTQIKRRGAEPRKTRVSDRIPIPKGSQWQFFFKDSQN